MDAWSDAKVYKKPATKVADKPAPKAPEQTPSPKKKVLKKRKIDQYYEKIPKPESEKRIKAVTAADLINSLNPKVAPYVSPLGDEPLIVTPEQCEIAVQEILSDKKNKLIAVDCEGVNLGRNGRLCLVQVATSSKAYLFDIIEGGPGIFDSGLRKLLESKDLLKVMHDCRLDSDALFHEHKVLLNNVFDTQVAFAIVTRGKGYSTPLPVGLNTLLKHYAHGASNEVKDHMKQAMQNDPEYWLKRPMDENALKYARQDVIFLCTVQRQMDALLSVSTRKNVAFYSDFYTEQYRKLEEAVVRNPPQATPDTPITSNTTNITHITNTRNTTSTDNTSNTTSTENTTNTTSTTNITQTTNTSAGTTNTTSTVNTTHTTSTTPTTERFIPKYGIKEWDMDCALNLERNANGRHRRKS
eukprot:Phypoly_transcript_07697.p1 GENE.Phypoly_transcript_07697~~Phypoly_transcript_07697.p1  ORF type:complete len:427 (+),score=69.81 Phypoly_transcript_07697:48-1283(+)